jgi:hypothetical protein
LETRETVGIEYMGVGRTRRRNLQKVGDDVRDEYVEWVNITILLEEVVEILKVSK